MRDLAFEVASSMEKGRYRGLIKGGCKIEASSCRGCSVEIPSVAGSRFEQ
jgi:hypothetical protein